MTVTTRPAHRVVFIDHIARLSGGEIALVRLIEATADRVSAHVILGEEGPLVDRLQDAGANVEVLQMPQSLRDIRKDHITPRQLPWRTATGLPRYIWTLSRRLRELRPDLVHTNSLKAAVYGGIAAKLAGRPLVWHVRDRIAPDYLPLPAVLAVRWLSRVLPDRVLTNSATTLGTIPLTSRTSVFYNAMTPTGHVPTAAPVRDRHGKPLTIGMVGRIAPWKGQDVVLRAFAEAFAGGSQQLHLIGSTLFGEEGYESSLRDLTRELGIQQQVSWRGFRADVAAELAAVDVLVHASTTPEPFGQVVVEGMQAGLPVIAAADGGPVEIIDDGRDGLLVEPGDVPALAAAMRRLADDPALRAELGEAARAVSQRFAAERAAHRLDSIYTAVRRGTAVS